MLEYSVYGIVSESAASVYIGSTSKPPLARFQQHCNLLKNGVHHCQALQTLWNDQGVSNISLLMLEAVLDNMPRRREAFWATEYQSRGYTLLNERRILIVHALRTIRTTNQLRRNCKITQDQAQTIYTAYHSKTATVLDLSNEFGLSRQAVYNIVNDVAWKH